MSLDSHVRSSRRRFLKGVAAGAAAMPLQQFAFAAQAPTAAPASGISVPPAPNDGVQRRVFRPSSLLRPKNGEGSGVVLKDGSILLLWTEFMDVDLMPEKERPPFSPLRKSMSKAPNNDDGYARVVGAISRDGGLTWSEPRVHVDDRDARVNTMSPALVRLKDGRLMVAYSWRSGGNHADNYGPCARRVRFSGDEGATWSEPTRITPDDGTYHTGCHDRAWVLDSGRILVQCHTNTKPRAGSKYQDQKHVYIAYSDDAGKSWRLSNRLTEPVARGLNESCVVPRADGSLLMVLRSWRGQAFYSESRDGAAWSEPRPSGIVAPEAPTYLTRLPGTPDILMVWNPNVQSRSQDLRLAAAGDQPARTVRVSAHATARCPLLCAVSRDGGRIWGLPKIIEDDINYEWAYPGVVFHEGHALIHYFRAGMFERRRELVLARMPLAWFASGAG